MLGPAVEAGRASADYFSGRVIRDLLADGLLVTNKSGVAGSLAAVVSDIVRELTSNPCIAMHGNVQYALGELFVGRMLEYAAHARIEPSLASSSSADFVVLPSILQEPETADVAQLHAGIALACLRDLGLSGERAVFVTSRAHRDILVQGTFPLNNETLYSNPTLSRAVFVSTESHSNDCYGVEGRRLRQLDGPYVAALHARNERPAQCRSQNWPLGLLRASERPISIFLSSGFRKTYIREIFRGNVKRCARDASSNPSGACAFLDLSNATGIERPLNLTLALYGASRICLHPAGDTPMRRAFYDSLLMGCIPVTLRPDPGRNPFCDNPWHYANDVVLPFMSALSDLPTADWGEYERRRIIGLLLDVPPAKLDEIQAKLLALAHGVQYRQPLGEVSFDAAQEHDNLDAIDYLLESVALGREFS